ncbi:MAG: sigma-70 family RNA polymerase sigma factor [Phycisphaerae bacterium]|nr:sigma-70 family RNA polymerase sigma factor [Phycisphaerae bacterium]
MTASAAMSHPSRGNDRVDPEVAPTSSAAEDAVIDALTARMTAGDAAAYEAVFRRSCGFVASEALRRLGRRRDLTEDVAQETWLRVARAPRHCPSSASLDAWLRRLVRSAAIDLLRSELARRCREEHAAMSRAEAVDFLDDMEVLEEIRREVAEVGGITPEERSLFELQARTGATVARLAAWLGIGRSALDSRLRRAAERARARRNSS